MEIDMNEHGTRSAGEARDRPLRIKMDALVHDLSEALKDSSCPSTTKIKGFRRRTRSAGNIAHLTHKAPHSDDSISERLYSLGKDHGQSDSDEVSANSRRLVPYPLKKRPPHLNFDASYIESDSVNENFSPLRTDRRKRKMKRMDCDTGFPNPTAPAPFPSAVSLSVDHARLLSLPGPSGVRSLGKKKKPSKDGDRMDDAMGKRKRREKSADVESLHMRALMRAPGEQMELDRELASSSSLSSSESDAGLQTNDEGREGDDEQSDWFADTRNDDETDVEAGTSAFHSIFNGPLGPMTDDARQAISERIEWLRGGMNDHERKINGGRRRVHDERPGFSILTSANEKLSRFLQDCEKLTLRLHPMDLPEREQLAQLAKMYSLRMKLEVTVRGDVCPILSKTSATPRTVRVDQTGVHGSVHKKRRKLPHPGINVDMAWEQPPLRSSDTKD